MRISRKGFQNETAETGNHSRCRSIAARVPVHNPKCSSVQAVDYIGRDEELAPKKREFLIHYVEGFDY